MIGLRPVSSARNPPTDVRPDPDDLLAQMQAESRAAQRGKLRIYFGASAGVGKTYAMLSAAQQALKAGHTVCAGWIETHGRPETAALLTGLPQLARVQRRYRDQWLPEFDLDGALQQHPEILLVDELAHSNAPGSRHPKRWQDVQELLAAGIDVWTAINVQHLESLNGTVGQITGIRVQETVPDTLLDDADELILVDVTADELLARLRAGKVYLPQQVERAAQNFFRKGNLFALRELALRRTAEHVGDDVRSYRAKLRQRQKLPAEPAFGPAPTQSQLPCAWNTSDALLVAVGPDPNAQNAVRSGARLAAQLGSRWHAVYIETPNLQRLPAAQRNRILSVLKLAEELGGQTAVISASDVPDGLLGQAQKLNCATLVLGRPAPLQQAWRRGWRRLHRHWMPSMAQQIAALAPDINLLEVGTSPTVRQIHSVLNLEGESERSATPTPWPAYGWTVLACFGTTVLTSPMLDRLDLANIVMLFLLCVVLVAFRFGRGPAMLSAVLSVAAFDFFCVPPRFSFAVSDVQYLLTFVVMLGVGLLIGQLTANLRFSASVSASRERRAQALFELTRDLSAALQADQVVSLGQAAVCRSFGGEALILVANASDQLELGPQAPEAVDASIVQWVFRNGQRAGVGTATLPANRWHYVPLQAPMRTRGVLVLQPSQARWLLIPEQIQQLETLARQIAIALERVHYVEVAQSAVVDMESERLRNTLLAAISHDVRTPLTALIGQAQTLSQADTLSAAHREIVRSMGHEARGLSALVSNLLDMARLESGGVQLRRDWQSVEELVGSAIRAARHALGDCVVQTDLPPDLPLVQLDAVLMERVLVNLLENAAQYGCIDSAAPAAVRISARVEAAARSNRVNGAKTDRLLLSVRDYGPGLPASVRGQEHTLFDKFTRGQTESNQRGVGLGLAICKAIVRAHDGHISAQTAPGGGAEFSISLPCGQPPMLPPEEGASNPSET